jgi:hypothetical protein
LVSDTGRTNRPVAKSSPAMQRAFSFGEFARQRILDIDFPFLKKQLQRARAAWVIARNDGRPGEHVRGEAR